MSTTLTYPCDCCTGECSCSNCGGTCPTLKFSMAVEDDPEADQPCANCEALSLTDFVLYPFFVEDGVCYWFSAAGADFEICDSGCNIGSIPWTLSLFFGVYILSTPAIPIGTSIFPCDQTGHITYECAEGDFNCPGTSLFTFSSTGINCSFPATITVESV